MSLINNKRSSRSHKYLDNTKTSRQIAATKYSKHVTPVCCVAFMRVFLPTTNQDYYIADHFEYKDIFV